MRVKTFSLILFFALLLALSTYAQEPTEPPPTVEEPTLSPATETPVAPIPTEPPIPTEIPIATETPFSAVTETALPTVTETASPSATFDTATPTPSLTASATGLLSETPTSTSTVFPSPTDNLFPDTGNPPLSNVSLRVDQDFDKGGDPFSDFYGIFPRLLYTPSGYGVAFNDPQQRIQVTSGGYPDPILDVRVAVISGALRIGLRESDADGYTLIFQHTGEIYLYRAGTLLVSATVTPEARIHALRFSAVGSELVVMLDGTTLFTYTDPTPLNNGFVTIGTQGTSPVGVFLDDIRLWLPTPPSSEVQALGISRFSSPPGAYFSSHLDPSEALVFSPSTAMQTANPIHVVGAFSWEQFSIPGTYAIQQPAVSPNGQWIAFQFRETEGATEGLTGVGIIAADGSAATFFPVIQAEPVICNPLDLICIGDPPSPPIYANPAWSPDSDRLAYNVITDGSTVELIDVNPVLQTTTNRIPFLAQCGISLVWIGDLLYCSGGARVGINPNYLQGYDVNTISAQPVYEFIPTVFVSGVETKLGVSRFDAVDTGSDILVAYEGFWTDSSFTNRSRIFFKALDGTIPPNTLSSASNDYDLNPIWSPDTEDLYFTRYIMGSGGTLSDPIGYIVEHSGGFILEPPEEPMPEIISNHLPDEWIVLLDVPPPTLTIGEQTATALVQSTPPVPPLTVTSIVLTLTAEATTRPLAGEECAPGEPWWRVQKWNENQRPTRPSFPDDDVNNTNAHHGVNAAWMEQIFGSRYDRAQADTVLMPANLHQITVNYFSKTWWGEYLLRHRGAVNISQATWSEIEDLAEQQFIRSETPPNCQTRYWDKFKEYARTAICKWLAEGLINNNPLALPQPVQDMWTSLLGFVVEGSLEEVVEQVKEACRGWR